MAQLLDRKGGTRLRTDAKVYCFTSISTIILVSVDDILVVGDHPDKLIGIPQQEQLLKATSTLEDGSSSDFLGRTIRKKGENYILFLPGQVC